MKKKDFYIAQVEVKEEKKENEKQYKDEKGRFQVEPFVSPYSGTRVKDIASFPYIKYGNRGSQYEGLRDRRKTSDQELIEKYGTKFYEFKQIQGIREKENEVETRLEQGHNTIDILDQDLEEYSKEPYQKPYLEDESDTELGKLRDLPPEEDDYDYYGNLTYSKNGINKGDPELSSNRQPLKKTPRLNEQNRRTIIRKARYQAPPLELLKRGPRNKPSDYSGVIYQKEIIDRTLSDFRIGGRVVHYTKGPTVTQFEVKLDAGVKVERVKNIARNLQMNLEGKSIRIEAPIPGKNTIGIEVPNLVQEKVHFGDLVSRSDFLEDGNPLNAVLGIDIGGECVSLDITSMPHALIAGTTGSGKSVCINTIINSILYKATPDQVRLVLIDPKLIEFSSYEDIPHLATPVINDPKLATTALKWAVDEMQSRYELFKACRCRDIISYNNLAENDSTFEKLPYIVIIIDELADLMFIAASSVEEYIQRLAQKARAAGIHLIMATQRPSTDVIKGPIKANIQTRIAFALNSQVDSMTILDKSGADKLLGKGDMLYSDGVNEVRVQGAFISLEEITAITDYIKDNYDANFLFSKEDLTEKMQYEENQGSDPREDEYFPIVAQDVVENNNASINRIQKRFGIGFNRAQAIMTGLEEMGIVSEGMAGKPRTVLVTLEELEDILNE